MLSALAGSGLTAAGIGGPGAAFGAEAPTATTGTTENPPPQVTETTPQAPTQTQGAGQQGTGSPQGTVQPTTTTSTSPTPSGVSTAPSAPATAPAPAAPAAGAPTPAPTVVVQRKQKTTRGGRQLGGTGANTGAGAVAQGAPGAGAQTKQSGPASVPAGTPNGVAPAPQTVGGEAGGLGALLGSAVSAQALDFYRIPLFLLPIYQAAAIQYDVPWQILAAINEVETDYGTDLSVSTAGAVGWMQFMPETWVQYGVDAIDAGYADPYNPVDAIFAAARYLHAAGASHNLHAAILAYNHSQAYVESVLLRAHLIAGYPSSVIATLTGLVDARMPTPGAHLAPGAVYLPAAANAPSANTPAGASSATAGAVPASPVAASPVASADAALHASTVGAAAHGDSARTGGPVVTALPGAKPAPPPLLAAARAEAVANAPAKASQLVDLLGRPGAPVVATQPGRVVHLGHSRVLGRYLVLRDIYGDVFTYAGLGSIVPRYRPAARPRAQVGGTPGAPIRDPAPTLPASVGHQPLTLKVKVKVAHKVQPAPALAAESESETAPPGMGRVRLYAHPGNPVARVAAARAARSRATHGSRWLPLRTGALVSQGTVLGHLGTTPGAGAGQLRFAVRPAGDGSTIDPRPLLANWRQLEVALHPQGSKGEIGLLGATAADALSMSKSELERSVLSDPGVQLDACGRRDVAAGAIDRRVLAVLEFLSRSGLEPTVGALQCPRHRDVAAGLASAHFAGNAVDISAINGIPIAGHQGPGTVTDATIRALLTLRGQFAPERIVSLMKYPEARNTLALAAEWDHIHIDFRAPAATGARVARAAAAGHGTPSVAAASGDLSQSQWEQLLARVAALPQPTVAAKPSSAAIRDPRAALVDRGQTPGG
jgi:membrane-bound lytic murein transglycosylase B